MSVQSQAGAESKARPGRAAAPRSGRRSPRLLLASALVASAVAAVPASAQAPSALTTADGVLYQSCVRHPVSYAANPRSGNWSLHLSTTRSDGSPGPFVSLSSHLGDQSAGSTTLDFCGYGDTAGVYAPGRYTLAATLSWVDPGGITHTEQLPSADFTMAKPQTRTTLTLSDRTPKPGQPIRFRVSVKVQSPTGWMRVPDAALPLRLRVLARGPGERTFRPLRGGAGVYDYGGTWSRKFRWLGTLPRAQFEAETRGNDLLAESTSKVVRVTTVYRDASSG
ncbi:hypothetical protein [Nocardioides astragali]|uniref:Uncharacterized protein n=1 Tax=Nocardioides astragali TaxID=1776736 RepID=A0ABW2MW83_9ACTN|nr:hypothetical protein [Nocardioides astragali]